TIQVIARQRFDTRCEDPIPKSAHESEIPRKKHFRGISFSWERRRDTFGKQAYFAVSVAPHSKRVLLDFEQNTWRFFEHIIFSGQQQAGRQNSGGDIRSMPYLTGQARDKIALTFADTFYIVASPQARNRLPFANPAFLLAGVALACQTISTRLYSFT
ncbi:MAG: hypothetical protein ONB49_19155, partial [candidate division KSB1 bacterium]|nr:hypothetical protein [candidate division KSB1 bacterium]